MASLKETKGRIASVKSTLKITSAMKMVASAKLHKAQNAIASMTPYERKLREMLQLLLASVPVEKRQVLAPENCATLGNIRGGDPSFELGGGPKDVFGGETPAVKTGTAKTVAIVAVASNSSLCGGFNGNVVREVKARINALEGEGCKVEVIAVGKKVADPMKKAGYPSQEDWNELVAHTSYAGADALAEKLQKDFYGGKYDRIELIYNHFVSTATQKVVCDTYLPMAPLSVEDGATRTWPEDLIIEPSAEEMLADLLPLVRSLRLYTVILDSVAAEHAARTVAMQTATDNGEDILQQLTLEYNKGRQQKITSEILDIVGGSMQ
jgi:F-type H+-transporting ATPase subunit gamma